MMRIDDAMLMAYLDGELCAADRAAVEQALAADAGLSRTLDEQRRLRAALSARYGPVAAEPVPERLLTMLGADGGRHGQDPDKVVSLSAARDRRRRPLWRDLGTIAASLAVGLLAGQMVVRQGAAPLAVERGALVAEGSLAAALETQLASARPSGAATRIGLTFRDHDGRYCRSFDTTGFSGLACREAENWRLLTTAPGPAGAPTEYRQAGSPALLETAEALMAGAPLDAAAERAALEAGWKR